MDLFIYLLKFVVKMFCYVVAFLKIKDKKDPFDRKPGNSNYNLLRKLNSKQ